MTEEMNKEFIVKAEELGVDPGYFTATELIRCKDCKWYKTNYSWNGTAYRVCVIDPYEPVREADYFCSRAERKEEHDEQ